MNPKVVVGGEHGKAQEDERPSTDEERAGSAVLGRAKKLDFVELRPLHGWLVPSS